MDSEKMTAGLIQFGGTTKISGGMRRTLVPLVLDGTPSWQLDTLAGVHHMSDRVVNGPRKGGNEQYAARYREAELMRCKTSAQ